MSEKGVRARPLAGGTDLLVQLRGGRFEVDRIVDIKEVPELNQISLSAAGFVLGAAVPCYRIYEDPKVIAAYPGLVDAASLIGGIQIQGRATIGGNLCNASPSGDSIPILIALDGSCVISGPRAERMIAVEDFCIGPGRSQLAPGEILVALRFPSPKPNSGAHYLRFIPRNEMDIAIVGVGAAVTLDGTKRTIQSARIALAAVGPTPIFAKDASSLLQGLPATEESIERAAEAAKIVARPIDDMRGTSKQRIHLVGVLTKRALRKAIERAKGA